MQKGGKVMPVIEVKMFAGRTNEQKSQLARRFTEVTVDTLGVKPEAVRVIIYDIPKENYAVAGETIAERER
jgi:4-oxalocrotonate tautomerase